MELTIKKNKPFTLLRKEMQRFDITQEYLAQLMNRSTLYVSDRFTGKKQWTLSDIYFLLTLFNKTPADIPEYFPQEGGMEDKIALAKTKYEKQIKRVLYKRR